MTDERERSAAAAVDALEREIRLREIEIACLHRARDTIARSIALTCDGATPTSQCRGPISAAWCRSCGHVVRRCDLHGGGRAAGQALHAHGRAKHGAGVSAPTDDEIAVLGGGETLPLDGLQAPPAPRGDEGGSTEGEHPGDDQEDDVGADD